MLLMPYKILLVRFLAGWPVVFYQFSCGKEVTSNRRERNASEYVLDSIVKTESVF